MKNFEPVPPPPHRPDAWWTRLFAYTVISLLITGFFVGAAIAYTYGLLDDSGYRSDRMTVEEHNAYVITAVRWAAFAGLAFSASYCIKEEWAHHERVARRGKN